jgi:hypothetical protein
LRFISPRRLICSNLTSRRLVDVSTGGERGFAGGSKVIFRKDFGAKAHPIGAKYPNPVNHYNIEIHSPYRNSYQQVENYHLIVDTAGKVIDILK